MQLFDIAFKNIIRRKTKTLSLILSIALGVFTINVLMLISENMNEEIANKFDEIGSNIVMVPNNDKLPLTYRGLTINNNDKPAELAQDTTIEKINKIKNRENISVIAPKLLGTLVIDEEELLAVGVEFEAEFHIKKWWNLQGTIPKEENEIILGNTIARKLEKEVGSTVTIKNRKLRVSGILNEIGSEEDNVIFVNLSFLQKYLNKDNKLSYIEISALCHTCPIELIVEQISAKLPHAEVTAIKEAVEVRKEIVDKFTFFAKGISLLVLLIGLLIVGLSSATAINRRISEIGVLRAIGLNKLHVGWIFILEIILISVIGGFIGSIGGFLLAKWLAPIIAQMEVSVVFDSRQVILTIVFTVFAGIIASLIPVLKATYKDPTDTLRHF